MSPLHGAALLAVVVTVGTAAMTVAFGGEAGLWTGLLLLVLGGLVLAVSHLVVRKRGRLGPLSLQLGGGVLLTLGVALVGDGVEIESRDELAELAAAANQLSAELAESEQRRRDLLVAVSHDLRTPLSSIRLLVEAIEDGMLNDESQREHSGRCPSTSAPSTI